LNITSWIASPHPFLSEFWAGESQLDFVTTEHWEEPTSFNTTPLHSIGSGRGSLVFYNQGSAFLYKLTGQKHIDGAVAKYGGMEKLATAMAVEGQKRLSHLPPIDQSPVSCYVFVGLAATQILDDPHR
jgi:hypothetical protein